MVEKKTKPEAAEPKAATLNKAPAVKAAASKKAAAAKSAAEKPLSEKPKSEKIPAKTGATVTLEQIRSPIGRQNYQRATLIGLGLNKLHRTRTLEDTPSVRGMIAKVKHLVKVVE